MSRPSRRTLDFAESAVLPLVGITAWEALVDRANVRPGEKVLVHAGAGGVGHIAIQIAKALRGKGLHDGVLGGQRADWPQSLGADVAIDYKRQAVEEYVREHTGGAGFDVVFDTVGGANLAASFQAAAAGGRVACIAARGTHDLTTAHGKGLSLHVVFMLLPLLTGRGRAHHGEILRRLAGLVDGGRIRPVLDPEIFPFSRVGRCASKTRIRQGRRQDRAGQRSGVESSRWSLVKMIHGLHGFFYTIKRCQEPFLPRPSSLRRINDHVEEGAEMLAVAGDVEAEHLHTL